MKTIYYFFGVIILINTLIRLLNFKDYIEKRDNFAKTMKDEDTKGKKWDDFSDEYKSAGYFVLMTLMTLLWFILGLFTYNYVLFLSYLVLGMLVSKMSGLIFKSKTNFISIIISWLLTLLQLLVVVFAIINSYHLKINLLDYIW